MTTNGWYYSQMQEMFLMDGLLAISESSRREAIEYLGVDSEKTWNIQAGVHADFQPVELNQAEHLSLLTRYGLSGPFILFVGAGDLRKNEAGLIDAYVRLPDRLRHRYQLMIVGHVPHDALHKKLDEAGCPSDRLIIVPFVEEGDLARLYSTCDLFVFPSLHEGFGLPAAEAMACGAPVIASNTSSLPEVVGLKDALFDPASPVDIAARMTEVLDNPDFRTHLVEHGLERAQLFTWEACAARAWDALEGIHDRVKTSKRRSSTVLTRKPSLAFVSPLPPQPSGISDYSRAILPNLAYHYDITLVCEDGNSDDAWLNANFPIISSHAFLQRAGRFDRTLYQVGSSTFHSFQYTDLLPSIPGVTVLHDSFLSLVWHWQSFHHGKTEEYLVELYRSHGYPALKYATSQGLSAAAEAYPACLTVLDQSLSIIQHSQHAQDLLVRYYGEPVRKRISIIPHLAHRRFRPLREEAREKLGLQSDEFVVCSFGMIAPTKLSTRLFEAWNIMEGDKGRLVYVGALATSDALPWTDGDLPPSVNVTGRVDQERYDLWLAAADVAVQLRTNSRGETSGAITDCLSAGLPLIVNAHGSAYELPHDVLVKLPDNFEITELRDAIVALRNDPERRQALGVAARTYVRKQLDAEYIAGRYRDVIEAAYQDDGSRLTMSISDSIARLAKDTTPAQSLRLEAVAASVQATFIRNSNRRRLLVSFDTAGLNAGSEGALSFTRFRPHLLARQYGDWRCEAVRVTNEKLLNAYVVGSSSIGCSPLALIDDPVDFRADDVLLLFDAGLSLTPDGVMHLKQRKLAGMSILVALDKIPSNSESRLADALEIADRVLCSSRHQADLLVAWLGQGPLTRQHPLAIDVVRLGGGFDDCAANESTDDAETLAAIACAMRRETFIVVGTSGLDQVLAAFKSFWANGGDAALIVVGGDETLRSRELFSELGTKLHLVNPKNSVTMQRLYGVSTCIIVAGDGATLPASLNEAVHAGLPVLVRDTALYREIAGPDAVYFTGNESEDLERRLLFWLGRDKREMAGKCKASTKLSWDKSASLLIKSIMSDDIYTIWPKPV